MVDEHREKSIHILPPRSIPGAKEVSHRICRISAVQPPRIPHRERTIRYSLQIPQPGILSRLKMKPVVQIFPIRIPVGIWRTRGKNDSIAGLHLIIFSVNLKFTAGPDQEQHVIGKPSGRYMR